MTVADILFVTNENTKVRIVGYNTENELIDLWVGKVGTVDFCNSLIPFGDYDIDEQYLSESEGCLYIRLCDNYHFNMNINMEEYLFNLDVSEYFR